MNSQVLIDLLFYTGTIVFSIGLIWAVAGRRAGAGMIFGAGMICQGVSLLIRYHMSFPLLPVYQGPFFLPFGAGLLGSIGKIKTVGDTGNERPERYHDPSLTLPRLFLVTVLSWLACLFPNDFYLPSLQFKTIFGHLFFLMGVAGKALFLSAGMPALRLLIAGRDSTAQKTLVFAMNRMLLWGFFFWTLSVFSGAAWSWLGWGAPVVWDDPAMATTMAAWLFYALVLHLHLTRFSSLKIRAGACLAGAIFVFFFSYVPELGPFRMLGWQLSGGL